MNIAGMSVKGKTLSIVIFSVVDGQFAIVKTTPKIELGSSDSQDEMKAFNTILGSFIRENHIDTVYLKSRSKKGQFSGGVDGFKIEAMLQLLPVPLVLISPQTIAAAKRKVEMTTPVSIHLYQAEAYETAYCGFMKNA